MTKATGKSPLKKKWGQHLLKNRRDAERIVDQLFNSPADYDVVIEVGPGRGALSGLIREKSNLPFYMLEIDADMRNWLINEGNFSPDQVVLCDFLEFDPYTGPWAGKKAALVGNFPYYISSPIFFKLLENRSFFTQITGMFQREVAQRITAVPGSKTYGILSVLADAFFNREYLFSLPPGAFNPPPKVHSAVIGLAAKEAGMSAETELHFRKLVTKAFSQRRKKLKNTLGGELLKMGADGLQNFVNKRPEELSAKDFLQIAMHQ